MVRTDYGIDGAVAYRVFPAIKLYLHRKETCALININSEVRP